ncbi:SDR family NAD(P)-dependent oxidoreductase, partial [Mitsuaria sp. WAJ17]|uniref:type I polyketide synthase n=1 Tax=Mitsuaria sp. WAJ17 TaxID=2761452 RepID=UPI0016042131
MSESTPDLSPIKKALLKIESLRRELDEARQGKEEPIAIVGMGCRLPGGADSPAQLWTLLAEGRDAIVKVPPDRWTDDLFDPQPGRPDTSYSRHGGFISDVDRFDAAFFGLSGREARRLDPQQRLLLECSWRALENAGFCRESLKSHLTGVFVGLSLDDYARLSDHVPPAEQSFAQTSLGTARPFSAGRIAYLFGFHGPTLQLDTACSSSLVTAHLACQALRNRECDLALSGGANLMLSPEMSIALSELQALSPDGRCKTFDAAANGYVRGEGAGMVALMRLSDAQAQGRPIRALILGSAINHDGRSNGMTAPNGRAQRDVIRAALQRAGLRPEQVDYVEAHGTGTQLGDPIELRALEEVYCRDVPRRQPLHVGSIKTNIGHLEGAASVAALIKVACSLEQAQLPRHLHFKNPSTHVDWARNGIRVADHHMDWPAQDPQRRIAAISAFGMSGTNAHLIIEAAPAAPTVRTGELRDERPQLLAFSAHSPELLARSLQDAAALLRQPDAPPLPDLAWSLRHLRDRHAWRACVVGQDAETVAAALDAEARRWASSEHAAPTSRSRLALLFTGQGAQTPGMARALYQNFATFRQVIDACDERFEGRAEHGLIDVLWGDRQDLIHETRYTQPALFAIELGLARLWMGWGVEPEFLMGHSVGEYAAACVAGVFTLEEGMDLISARGALMQDLCPPGRMCAVLASAQDLTPFLKPWRGRVELAGDNGPGSVVVAGDAEAMDALLAQLEGAGLQSRPLQVSRAFHSPLMEPMLAAFAQEARKLRLQAPRIPLVSNVTGRLELEAFCDPDYWVQHVRQAVLFRPGMQTLLEAGATDFLEIGPGQTLSKLARACAAPKTVRLHHSLDGHAELAALWTGLGALFAAGQEPQWNAVDRSLDQHGAPRAVSLPPYPLADTRYWLGERKPARAGLLQGSAFLGKARDPSLLGPALHLPGGGRERRHEQRLSLASHPFLAGHAVHGQALFPAAGYLALMLDVQRPDGSGPGEPVRLRDVAFEQALPLSADQALRLVTVVDGERIEIHTAPDAGPQPPTWTLHAGGQAAAAAADIPSTSLQAWRERCAEVLAPEQLYAALGEAGLHYSGAFHALAGLWCAAGAESWEALGRVERVGAATGASHLADPALLDACLQVVAAVCLKQGMEGQVLLPVGLEALDCHAAIGRAQRLWCAVRVQATGAQRRADLWIHDEDGRCLMALQGLQLHAVAASQLRPASAAPVQAHSLAWQTLAPAPRSGAAPQVALLSSPDGCASLAEDLRSLWRDHQQQLDLLPAAPPAGDAASPEATAHWQQALRDWAARAAPGQPLVLLQDWQPPCTDDASGPQRLEAVGEAYAALAGLWQALQALDLGERPLSLALLTHGAQAEGAEDVRPEQSAAWGLGRSLMHESTELPVLLLDLPALPTPQTLQQLHALLCDSELGEERQFMLRDAGLRVPRLQGAALPASQPMTLEPGTYLLTGARGALGLQLLERLLQGPGRRIVALGRQLPEPGVMEHWQQQARAAGSELRWQALDVADGPAVQALIDSLSRDGGPALNGVFHCAGVLQDGLLASQDQACVRQVLAPKLAGAFHLHQATQDLTLQHFVLFSSVVSCIGSPGQCAYATANAYLDGLAQLRRSRGLAALSLNWGLWGGEGMAGQLDETQKQRAAAFGLLDMPPAAALQAMDAVLAQPQAAAAPHQRLLWSVDTALLAQRTRAPGLRR